MATPVKLLILDADTGLHRVIAYGEEAVDGSGNPINTLDAVLAVDNDANAQQIKNLAAPTANGDAATKLYVDTAISGNNELSEILANGNDANSLQIKNMADPTLAQDAVTKTYVDTFLIEDFPTDEDSSGSSSSPGPGQAIRVLTPDGGGGVTWVDLTTTIEDSVTGELTTGTVLQPDGSGGVEWNSRVGIGTTPDVSSIMHVYEDIADIMYLRIENPSAAAASVVGATVQLVGDTGWGLIGYTCSGSTILGGIFASTLHFYNQGFGNSLYTVDGNKDHVWYTDPTDSHDFSALGHEVMRLAADGTLTAMGPVHIGANGIGNDAMALSFEAGEGGTSTFYGAVDMGCNDLLFVDTIYFCEEGSSSSSSAVDDTPTGVWIAPDRTNHRALVYHAPDGHEFESPVSFNGTVSLNNHAILMGTGAIGRSGAVLTFAAGATGTASFAGVVNVPTGSAAAPSLRFGGIPDIGLFMVGTATVAVSAFGNEVIRFSDADGATPIVTTNNAPIYVGTAGIGNDSQALSFASTSGNATFAGNIYTGTSNGIGGSSAEITFPDGSNVQFSGGIGLTSGNAIGIDIASKFAFYGSYIDILNGDLHVSGNGIGNDNPILTFAAGAAGEATFAGDVDVASGKVYLVNGTQVVAAQENHIIDADGQLADITTKFNTLLASLETHGLLAAA